MRKIFSALLALSLLCGLFSGCGDTAGTEAGTLSVVATIFPIYDWTREILGDNPGGVKLTLLLDKGVDMHSYQPTVDDLVEISTCDLFIYVGGESDAWVDGALKEAVNKDMTAVGLMDVLGNAAKLEETLEGMQGGAEEDAEFDEHVWLSLKNAALFCGAIRDALSRLDPERRDAYARNAAAYLERLDALDGEYEKAVLYALVRSDRPHGVLLFADRFPFRYLVDDYLILECYAAFPGCEAETDASFETIAFLAGRVDELGLPAVLTTESPVPRLAETVVENTRSKSAKILTLDSMQSITASDIENGAAYLSIMEQNLEILKEAL